MGGLIICGAIEITYSRYSYHNLSHSLEPMAEGWGGGHIIINNALTVAHNLGF